MMEVLVVAIAYNSTRTRAVCGVTRGATRDEQTQEDYRRDSGSRVAFLEFELVFVFVCYLLVPNW